MDERQTLMTGDRTTSYKTFKLSFKETPEDVLKHSDDNSRDTAVNDEEGPMPEFREKTGGDEMGLTDEMRLTMQLNDNLQSQMQDEVLQNIVSQFWKQDARKTAAFVKASRFQTIANNSSSSSGKQ